MLVKSKVNVNLQSVTVPTVLLFVGKKLEKMNVSVLQGSVVKTFPHSIPCLSDLIYLLASKFDDSQICVSNAEIFLDLQFLFYKSNCLLDEDTCRSLNCV